MGVFLALSADSSLPLFGGKSQRGRWRGRGGTTELASHAEGRKDRGEGVKEGRLLLHNVCCWPPLHDAFCHASPRARHERCGQPGGREGVRSAVQ